MVYFRILDLFVSLYSIYIIYISCPVKKIDHQKNYEFLLKNFTTKNDKLKAIVK